MNRFEGKHIIVTGGTGGIGLATAERLLDEGATVLLTGRDAAKIEELAARDRVHAIANDSSDPDAASALAEAAKTHLGGRVDGVFLNAGYGGFAPLGEIRGEDFERMMNVNVRAPLLQLGALSPLLSEGAAILFNSSIVNDMKMPGSAVYAATKGAVRSAMNAVSAEMAGRGIRVNAVSPGPIDTGFFSATGLSEEEIAGFGEQILAQVPLGRFGEAREIAAGGGGLPAVERRELRARHRARRRRRDELMHSRANAPVPVRVPAVGPDVADRLGHRDRAGCRARRRAAARLGNGLAVGMAGRLPDGTGGRPRSCGRLVARAVRSPEMVSNAGGTPNVSESTVGTSTAGTLTAGTPRGRVPPGTMAGERA